MSEIEAEIRRQMLEERDRALRNAAASSSEAPPAVPPLPAAPPDPSFHALPPPAFPQAGSHYPSSYGRPEQPVLPPQPPQASLPPPPPSAAPNSQPKTPPRKGIMGALSAIGIALVKFGGALKAALFSFKFLAIGKYLLTAGSMLLSVVALAAYVGVWQVAVGVVGLIFLHELGHALALKRLGMTVRSMVFIPFMGAFVTHDRASSTANAAQIAIMGPVAGALAGLACASVYGMTGSPFWLVLAFFSFLMNLFNLSAIPVLDGGHITPLISPKVLLGGLIAVAAINYRFPICWLLVLMALPQAVERWNVGVDPGLKVSKQDQQTYTLAYLGLVLFLGFAGVTTHDWILALRHLPGHRF